MFLAYHETRQPGAVLAGRGVPPYADLLRFCPHFPPFLANSRMTRRYINQFGDRENIDEIFLVSEKQLRNNRNGNL